MIGKLFATMNSAAPQPDESSPENLLQLLDLSQAQVAALLGVSPQAVSKWYKDEGNDFLSKDRRAQRLISAQKLKSAAKQFSWGMLIDSYIQQITPRDLYESSDELWFVSDDPTKMIDWPSLENAIFLGDRNDRQKVIVFLMKTLDGAESFAETLEREAIRPAIQGGQLNKEKIRQFCANVYIIVTNLTPYTNDFMISNPGSPCMGVVATTKPPCQYQWNYGNYSASNFTCGELIKFLHQYRLGATTKSNFFPLGKKLTPDMLNFPHAYSDALIAVAGESEQKDKTATGEALAGGMLKNLIRRDLPTQEFNKRTKFRAVFVLTYKRRPGDDSKKTVSIAERIFRTEIATTEINNQGDATADRKSTSFWGDD